MAGRDALFGTSGHGIRRFHDRWREQGSLFDTADKWSEDETMKRGDRIPVRATEQATGPEQSSLDEERSCVLGLGGDRPLEPRVTREAHLRAQSQQMVRFESFDTPEVDYVADA